MMTFIREETTPVEAQEQTDVRFDVRAQSYQPIIEGLLFCCRIFNFCNTAAMSAESAGLVKVGNNH